MPMCSYELGEGDSFLHVSAGGGGFGQAFDRDPDAVLQDVLDEKVSVDAAERDYGGGVDLAKGAVDRRRTAETRQG